MKRRDVTARALAERGWALCMGKNDKRYDLEDVARRCREGASVRFNTSTLTKLTFVLVNGEFMLWRKATQDELAAEAKRLDDERWERGLRRIHARNSRTMRRKYGY